MIRLTTMATEKVKEIRKAEGTENYGLRVRVVAGGCSGFSYDLYFDEQPTPDDKVFETDGVKIFIDNLSYRYLEGTEIDYVESIAGAGFKFSNPQSKGSCGCGKSFNA
jgi:iron-sulfur cluster insertion protein